MLEVYSISTYYNTQSRLRIKGNWFIICQIIQHVQFYSHCHQIPLNTVLYSPCMEQDKWIEYMNTTKCFLPFRPWKIPTCQPGRTSRGRRSSLPTCNTSTSLSSTACVWMETRSSWCLSTWSTETLTSSWGNCTHVHTLRITKILEWFLNIELFVTCYLT